MLKAYSYGVLLVLNEQEVSRDKLIVTPDQQPWKLMIIEQKSRAGSRNIAFFLVARQH